MANCNKALMKNSQNRVTKFKRLNNFEIRDFSMIYYWLNKSDQLEKLF